MNKRLGLWVLSVLVFVAIWSRIGKMQEGPKTIKGLSNAISNVFRGVLK